MVRESRGTEVSVHRVWKTEGGGEEVEGLKQGNMFLSESRESTGCNFTSHIGYI